MVFQDMIYEVVDFFPGWVCPSRSGRSNIQLWYLPLQHKIFFHVCYAFIVIWFICKVFLQLNLLTDWCAGRSRLTPLYIIVKVSCWPWSVLNISFTTFIRSSTRVMDSYQQQAQKPMQWRWTPRSNAATATYNFTLHSITLKIGIKDTF